MNGSGRRQSSASFDVSILDRGLESFRDLLLSHTQVDAMLQSVCGQVVATVPGADLAGVTLFDETTRQPRTAASTDPRVLALDADQYRLYEGPCMEAAQTQQIVRVRSSEIADRWPTLAADVSNIGVHSYLSAPISVDTAQVGSLNVYSWTDHGFTDTDEMLVEVFVTAVEDAVRNSRRAHKAHVELEGLREAMRTRATIEQAKGIVMAIRGIDADEAFEVLSLQSQSENVKLTAIAQRIVASVASTK